MITTILSTIVVLGVLIFVHELGHFLVAKKSGVAVERFSLGFGPKIAGIVRGETEYRLSLIPLGGYVKMLGEEPDEEVAEADHARSFSSQPVGKRTAIVLAGPLFNFFLAILLFTFINAFYGEPHATTKIESVNFGSAADKAGIKAGDRVISVNGSQIGSWEELTKIIEKQGEHPLTLVVKRGEESLTLQATPSLVEIKDDAGNTRMHPQLGIMSSSEYGNFNPSFVNNPFSALWYGLVLTLKWSWLFLVVVFKLIRGALPLNLLGGPILIAQQAGQQAHAGLAHFLDLMAIISVNLAVLNLLPIPVLDGGHIFFFALEGIKGKPISLKKIEMAQKVGLVLLLTLMVFVFYNDIMRLVHEHKLPFLH